MNRRPPRTGIRGPVLEGEEVGALAFEVVGVAAEPDGIGAQLIDGVTQPQAMGEELLIELGRHRALPGQVAGVQVQVEQGGAVELLGELQTGVGTAPEQVRLGEVPVGGVHPRSSSIVAPHRHRAWALTARPRGR